MPSSSFPSATANSIFIAFIKPGMSSWSRVTAGFAGLTGTFEDAGATAVDAGISSYDGAPPGIGPPPEDAVVGRVYVVEPMGAETWVTLEIAGARVIGRGQPGFVPRSGVAAWLLYDIDRALLFDARTGRRIER